MHYSASASASASTSSSAATHDDVSLKITECPVCFQSFDESQNRGPHVNGCGHSICRACFITIINGAEIGRNCPTCKQQLSNLIPCNFLAKDLLEIVATHERELEALERYLSETILSLERRKKIIDEFSQSLNIKELQKYCTETESLTMQINQARNLWQRVKEKKISYSYLCEEILKQQAILRTLERNHHVLKQEKHDLSESFNYEQRRIRTELQKQQAIHSELQSKKDEALQINYNLIQEQKTEILQLKSKIYQFLGLGLAIGVALGAAAASFYWGKSP